MPEFRFDPNLRERACGALKFCACIALSAACGVAASAVWLSSWTNDQGQQPRPQADGRTPRDQEFLPCPFSGALEWWLLFFGRIATSPVPPLFQRPSFSSRFLAVALLPSLRSCGSSVQDKAVLVSRRLAPAHHIASRSCVMEWNDKSFYDHSLRYLAHFWVGEATRLSRTKQVLLAPRGSYIRCSRIYKAPFSRYTGIESGPSDREVSLSRSVLEETSHAY